MASELRVTTIANNAGSESVNTTYVVNGSAKMWQGWAYSGGTPTSDDSFNVSSITDTGTGEAAFNLTSSMSSTTGNSVVCGSNHATEGNTLADKDSASIFAQRLFANGGTATDAGGNFSIQIHGDLA